jgi:heme-degrading monooxygenase HmoA
VSVVKINVLTVSPELRETLEERFAARAGAVDGADGFEWFELLRPVEGTDNYLVYTRWRDEAAFEAWRAAPAGGAGAAHGGPPAGGGGPVGGAGAAHAGAPAGGPAGGPAASGAELWSFEVVQSAGPTA